MDESCFPYAGKDSPCGVSQSCRRVYAAEYQYVGGFYGGCSEAAMMVELVNNGPMAVAFEVWKRHFLSNFRIYISSNSSRPVVGVNIEGIR